MERDEPSPWPLRWFTPQVVKNSSCSTLRYACMGCNSFRNINVRLGNVVHKICEQKLYRKCDHLEYLLVGITCSANCIQVLISDLAAFLNERLRKADRNCSLWIVGC